MNRGRLCWQGRAKTKDLRRTIQITKTSILKNTSSQNVNESFHFILEDTENSALRIDLKEKMLNCKGK